MRPLVPELPAHALLRLLLALRRSRLHAGAASARRQAPQPQPHRPWPPSDDPDAAETAATKVPLDEIRRFVGVFNAVREAYVDPVDDHKLMQSAIKGLLLDLDPHSAYLEKDDAQAFDEETSGAYAGIGVEVQVQPDGTHQGRLADRRHARPRAPASSPATSSSRSTASRWPATTTTARGRCAARRAPRSR